MEFNKTLWSCPWNSDQKSKFCQRVEGVPGVGAGNEDCGVGGVLVESDRGGCPSRGVVWGCRSGGYYGVLDVVAMGFQGSIR